MPIFIFPYDRWSTKVQDNSNSKTRQRGAFGVWFREHGAQHRLTVGAGYHDPGKSAWNRKRNTGDLGRMLADIKGGVIIPRGSWISADTMCRLSRETTDTAMKTLLNEIWHYGITVVTTSDNYVYRPGGTADQIAKDMQHALNAMAIANGESEKKSRHVGSAKETARLAALHAGIPIAGVRKPWVRRVLTNTMVQFTVEGEEYEIAGAKFEEVPEVYPAIREVFRLALKGYGVQRITREMQMTQTHRCPTPRGAWTICYVHTLLHDQGLRGHYQPGRQSKATDNRKIAAGDLVENYYPVAIIDDVTWFAVQKIIGRSRDKLYARSSFRHASSCNDMFAGCSFRCAACGQRAVVHHEKNGEHRWFTYRCKSHRSAFPHVHRCALSTHVKRDPLERAVLETLSDVLFDMQQLVASRGSPEKAAAVTILQAEADRFQRLMDGTHDDMDKSESDSERENYRARNRQQMAARDMALGKLDTARHEFFAAQQVASSEHLMIGKDIIRAALAQDPDARFQVAAALRGLIDQMAFHSDRTVHVSVAGGAFLIIVDRFGGIADVRYTDEDGTVIMVSDDGADCWLNIRFAQTPAQLALFVRIRDLITRPVNASTQPIIAKLRAKLSVRKTMDEIAARVQSLAPGTSPGACAA